MPLSSIAAANKDARNAKETDTMQHRHFAVVAGIIKDLRGTMSESDVECVADHFASELRASNSKFNKARFLKACGF